MGGSSLDAVLCPQMERLLVVLRAAVLVCTIVLPAVYRKPDGRQGLRVWLASLFPGFRDG
jgi:hypothetical protein